MPEIQNRNLRALVSGNIYHMGCNVTSLIKTIAVIFFFTFILLVSMSVAENNDHLIISKIQYTEKQINELSEISLYATKDETHNKQLNNKVDELIGLLEAHKIAVEKGQEIDRLEETVKEINDLLEVQKTGPPKITINDFHSSICFQCHAINDFYPSDKTQKQWRRLLERDGHSIFAKISWESPQQRIQILEFLLENAGTYRAEGIGLWK
jgi:hypothetical protein